MEYLYPQKVDCIYIDPPYNTGARDWKYNNDYVDSSDSYRHSKWLSMMQKRLKIAKRILNPNDSVLIVTIDEKEYLHLGCLLEEMFPEANIQMVSTLTARSGAARFNSFSRVNEFIYFVMNGNYTITPIENANYQQEGDDIHWRSFRRGNPANIRTSRPSQFYPLYIDKNTYKIVKVGEPITPEVDRFSVSKMENCETVFPVRDDGTEMLWSVTPNACWAAVPQLAELFTDEQLADICEIPEAHWVFVSMGRDEIQRGNKALASYIDEITNTWLDENVIISGRTVWDSSYRKRTKSIKGISAGFIEKQPITWLHVFYKWLSETTKRTDSIKEMPVFLDQDRKAVAAFDSSEHLILFFPDKDLSGYTTVYSELLTDKGTCCIFGENRH